MEFLRELMDLQKEMVTLLLSMLEGNVLNGPIGKQMVDTLALCSNNVKQVLQFFTTFLKYSEIVSGVSFKVPFEKIHVETASPIWNFNEHIRPMRNQHLLKLNGHFLNEKWNTKTYSIRWHVPKNERIKIKSIFFYRINGLLLFFFNQEYDINGDGIIQPEEFRKILMSQKVYTEEQMNFLLECADKDSDGRISYKEFSERFSDPASEIGFNIALLFTNLSEHTTNDPRLDKLVEAAADLIDVFESQLGRIEILGGTKRIERVYFEISEENKSSWEAETIKVFINFKQNIKRKVS